MATADREELARSLLDQSSPLRARRRHTMKPGGSPPRSHRHKQGPRRLRPVSPSEKQLQQREQGWNGRFFYEPPINSNKLPRPDRPASISAHSPVAKERKIRDERAQYGTALNGKPEFKRRSDANRKPQHSKLMPLGSLPRPPSETQDPTKEEKLRFKVLKLIDARETLLYQLSALILCTPVHESLFMPSRPTEPPRSVGGGSGRQLIRPKAGMALAATPVAQFGGPSQGGGGAMTNAREATKMAQKIATDLQEVGIQCVEALVEWMLEAGAKAEKPPPFLWRGRNYFLKMCSDLDFAEAELKARGVCLDCYSQKNPLLIRPEQKLGRVLAAQSIINEMIEMASEPTPQEVLSRSPTLSKKSPDTDKQREKSPLGPQSDGGDPAQPDAISLLDMEPDGYREKSDSARSSDLDDSVAVNNERDEGNNAGDEVSDQGSDDEEAKDMVSAVFERDPEAEVELVTMLDESLSNFPNIRPQLSGVVAASEELGDHHMSSARTEASNQSAEYDDNNFEDDAAAADGEEGVDNESQQDCEVAATDNGFGSCPVDENVSTAAEELDGEHELPSPSVSARALDREDQDEEAFSDDDNGEAPPTQPRPDSAKMANAQPPREILLEELEKWARAPQPRASLLVGSVESLEWQGTDALEAAVRENASPVPCLQSSLLWALTESLLVPPHSQLRSFLSSATSQSLNVRTLLCRECCLIVSSVGGVLASLIECSLKNENPLVSEIDVAEVLEIAESVFRSQDDGVWKYVGVATRLLTPENLGDADNSSLSSSCRGLNALVNVFYPYLTSQPRERLPLLWASLSRLLARYFLRFSDLTYMLDPSLKSMALVVASMNGGGISDFSDAPVDLIAVPKLSLVCERGNVLRSSLDVVWTKRLALPPPSPRGSDQVFPFFRSPFGEKMVEGVRVEEGEGRGPLKEWFSLLGRELVAKWRLLPLGGSAMHVHERDSGEHLVTASGNKLVLPPSIAHFARPGFQVEWSADSSLESLGEGTVTRVINNKQDSSDQPGTFLLDRGVASQSFPAAQLQLAEPRTPVLEYVQASEAFRLNAQTADSIENRRTLTFTGWLLASAVTHNCSINLRLHPLMLTLLLNRGYRVTLDDVRALDPTLSKSLENIKTMPDSELASLLELEGADPALNADEYVASVVDSTFGAASGIGWQLEVMRQGFDSVVPLDLAAKLGISGQDLAAIICGTDEAASTRDFSIDNIFRIATDADFAACHPLRRGFWRVVNAFEPSLKRKLVKFITGVDTLPLPGTEFLRIEMPFPSLSASDHAKSLQMLPHAHTCDNTLELPHYWKALCWQSGHDESEDSEELENALVSLLTKKLQTAVGYSEGYGLDGTVNASGTLLPGMHLASQAGDYDPIEKEESYESLDLPALQSGEHGDAADEANAASEPQTEEDSPPIEPPPANAASTADAAAASGDRQDAEDAEDAAAPVTSARAEGKEESEEEYDDWEEEEEEA